MDSTDDSYTPRRSLQIGVVAYEAMPGFVFVRVPNERGRWVLTERCVAEVDCKMCGAIAGEPCMATKGWRKNPPGNPGFHRYHTGTHAVRRNDGKKFRKDRQNPPKPKLRVRPDDLELASAEPTHEAAENDAAYVPSPLVIPKGVRWVTAEDAGTYLDRSLREIHNAIRNKWIEGVEGQQPPDMSHPIGMARWWVSVDSIIAFHKDLR